MAKVTIVKNGKTYEVESDGTLTLLELCNENDIEMEQACGGNGVCTTCLVEVKEGAENLSEITDREEMMGMDPEDPKQRLGCQCKANGDCTVELAY